MQTPGPELQAHSTHGVVPGKHWGASAGVKGFGVLQVPSGAAARSPGRQRWWPEQGCAHLAAEARASSGGLGSCGPLVSPCSPTAAGPPHGHVHGREPGDGDQAGTHSGEEGLAVPSSCGDLGCQWALPSLQGLPGVTVRVAAYKCTAGGPSCTGAHGSGVLGRHPRLP